MLNFGRSVQILGRLCRGHMTRYRRLGQKRSRANRLHTRMMPFIAALVANFFAWAVSTLARSPRSSLDAAAENNSRAA